MLLVVVVAFAGEEVDFETGQPWRMHLPVSMLASRKKGCGRRWKEFVLV